MNEFPAELLAYVAQLARMNPAELTPEQPLFASGIIDSLNLLELVSFVEQRCGISVGPGDLTLDNWNTLQSIEAYVARMTSR